MAVEEHKNSPQPRSIPSLRWWIGGILFASTVLNYINRQTLSILVPYLNCEECTLFRNLDGSIIAGHFKIA